MATGPRNFEKQVKRLAGATVAKDTGGKEAVRRRQENFPVGLDGDRKGGKNPRNRTQRRALSFEPTRKVE